MTRTNLDDAQWASLMLVIQRIPHTWKRDAAGLRRFVVAVLWVLRTGAPWRDLPETLGHWPSVYHRFRRWCVRGWWEFIFEHLRPALPTGGLVLVDSTTCKAHRTASGAAHSTPEAEALGRSRGGICSKIHAYTDGTGRILRLVDSPGHHSDLRYARALMADIPATDAALDRGYVSAKLRSDLAAQGCTVHTPPKQGMLNPPPWNKTIYAQRHHIENLFARLKNQARIALRRDKTRRSWMGFAHLAATLINLQLTQFQSQTLDLLPGCFEVYDMPIARAVPAYRSDRRLDLCMISKALARIRHGLAKRSEGGDLRQFLPPRRIEEATLPLWTRSCSLAPFWPGLNWPYSTSS